MGVKRPRLALSPTVYQDKQGALNPARQDSSLMFSLLDKPEMVNLDQDQDKETGDTTVVICIFYPVKAREGEHNRDEKR